MLEPKSAALQYLLGRAYQASGDTKQAEKAFMKAIELNPEAVPAYVSLGPDLRRVEGVRPRDRRARQGARVAARPAGGAHAQVDRAADEGRQQRARARATRSCSRRTRASPPPANNLAWMLAEEGPGKDLKRAYPAGAGGARRGAAGPADRGHARLGALQAGRLSRVPRRCCARPPRSCPPTPRCSTTWDGAGQARQATPMRAPRSRRASSCRRTTRAPRRRGRRSPSLPPPR